MKFQVSVLSDKGVKKLVATVDADSFTEETGELGRKNIFSFSSTLLKFWTEGGGFWGMGKTLTASVLVSGGYVVEQVYL